MDVVFLSDTEKELVRRSALGASMDDAAFERILASGAVVDFKRNEVLFDQGHEADIFYLVLRGWAQIKIIEGNGVSTLISAVGAGGMLGDASSFAQMPFPATAQAMTDMRVFGMSGLVLIEIMQDDPNVLRAALRSHEAGLRALMLEIETLKSRTLRERLALFLLDHLTEETTPASVLLPFGKALVAAKIGTSPEQLSRTFRELQPHGVHVSGRTAVIDDPGALRKMLCRAG